jgi:hypothetical protein
MTRSRRPLRIVAAVTAVAMMTSACTSDPAFWDAMATGLELAAADMAWENANCYWAPPPGSPYGVAQQYCPGSYGYRTPVVYIDRPHRDHRRGEHRRGGRGGPRDRDRRN